jgi:hypothetical protein
MYRASHLVKLLSKNNPNIQKIEGIKYIKCPVDVTCRSSPEKCNKGKNRKCNKSITIFYTFCGLTGMVPPIYFVFMISSDDHDGFISKNDSSLELLFSRNIINQSELDAMSKNEPI